MIFLAPNRRFEKPRHATRATRSTPTTSGSPWSGSSSARRPSRSSGVRSSSTTVRSGAATARGVAIGDRPAVRACRDGRCGGVDLLPRRWLCIPQLGRSVGHCSQPVARIPRSGEVGVDHDLHGALPATELVGVGCDQGGFRSRRHRISRRQHHVARCLRAAGVRRGACRPDARSARGIRHTPQRSGGRGGPALWSAPAQGRGRRLDQRDAIRARAGLPPGFASRVSANGGAHADAPAGCGARAVCRLAGRKARCSGFPRGVGRARRLAAEATRADEPFRGVAICGAGRRGGRHRERGAHVRHQRHAVALPRAIGRGGAVCLSLAHHRARVADAAGRLAGRSGDQPRCRRHGAPCAGGCVPGGVDRATSMAGARRGVGRVPRAAGSGGRTGAERPAGYCRSVHLSAWRRRGDRGGGGRGAMGVGAQGPEITSPPSSCWCCWRPRP